MQINLPTPVFTVDVEVVIDINRTDYWSQEDKWTATIMVGNNTVMHREYTYGDTTYFFIGGIYDKEDAERAILAEFAEKMKEFLNG